MIINFRQVDIAICHHLQLSLNARSCMCEGVRDLEILPPTNYALSLHNKRYNYHAKLWLQADHAIMNLENEPTQSIAWKLFCSACKESETYAINSSVCKKKRLSVICKCSTASLKCTRAGGCDAIDCANPI